MAKILTDAAAKAAKPRAVAYELPDNRVQGLALRVAVSGRKTWSLRVVTAHGRRRVDLGPYPVEADGQRIGVTVAAARKLALKALDLASRGENPEHAIRPPETDVTIEEVIERWLATKAGNRSLAAERRRMELHVVPTIGSADVALPTAQMHAALHKLVNDMAPLMPVQANRVYTSLRGLFGFCVEAGLRQDNPVTRFRRPTKEEPSARRRREGTEPLLDTSELAALWNAAPALDSSVLGDLLRCLLLVPLRREEWTGLRWSELHDDIVADGWKGVGLKLPAARMKGKRAALVPLPPLAVAIVEGRRKLTGRGDFVFSVPGSKTPFAGWRRGADTLREILGERPGWSPHTIRRSVATAMVRDLGADELLVQRLLQHSPRSVLGIIDTYQRSQRLAEQAALLTKWSNHLKSMAAALDAPAPRATVVKLKVPA